MGIFNFLFGGKTKKGEEKVNTTSAFNTGPYQPAQPYINDYLSANRDLYSSTPQFSPEEMEGYRYLGDAVANNTGDPNAAQNTGLMGLLQSMGVDPSMLAGRDVIAGTTSGRNGAIDAGLGSLAQADAGNPASDAGLMQLIRASRSNPTARNGMSMLYDAVNGPGVDNALSTHGLQDINAVSAAPSQYTNTSADTLNKTAAGDFLTPDTNPYLADIAKRISGIAGSQAQALFGGRGRSGSGLAGNYAGKAIGDSLTDMYGQVYESERGRQQQAALGAPGFDTATTNNALNVGTSKLNAGVGFGKALNDQNVGNASTLLNAGNTQQNQALQAGQTLFNAGNAATGLKQSTGQSLFNAGQGVMDNILKSGQALYSAGSGITDSSRAGAEGVFNAGTALNSQRGDTALKNAQALISAGQNISARPYDISGQYGNILANIGKLGSQGTATGTSDQVSYGTKPGLIGGIFNSFVNKLFGTTMNTGS